MGRSARRHLMNVRRWSAPTGSGPTFRTPGSYYLFGCRTVGNRPARGVVPHHSGPSRGTPCRHTGQHAAVATRQNQRPWTRRGAGEKPEKARARWATDSLTIEG